MVRLIGRVFFAFGLSCASLAMSADLWMEGERQAVWGRGDDWKVTAVLILIFGGAVVPIGIVVQGVRRRRARLGPVATRKEGQWGLGRVLFWLSKHDPITIGDMCMGCQIWGSTGSGKSTGSMAAICRAFLSKAAMFGGVFFTVKPDDRQVYERYIREAGREKDLLVYGPGHGHTFNFIMSELRAGGKFIENLTSLLTTVVELGERQSPGGGGRGEDFYWKRMLRQLCRNSIQLLVMAKGTFTVSDLYKVVISAPLSLDQVISKGWQSTSFCFECLMLADARQKTPQERHDYELLVSFFTNEWATLASRTRSIVLSSFSTTIDILNRGEARDLLSSPTPTIDPAMVQEGKLIIVDAPIMVHNELGQYLQIILKYCLQRAQNRRDVSKNPRPVFLVCDESHLLTVSADQVFQTTARSTRTCVVYATQSISNYLSVFGEKAEPEVHSLLGNLQLQIFHQQTDIRTNQYASELIGKSRQILCHANNSYQGEDGYPLFGGLSEPHQTSAGMNEVIDFELQPSHFTSLAKGGPPHWKVGAVVYHGGRQFRSNGRTWLPVQFDQK